MGWFSSIVDPGNVFGGNDGGFSVTGALDPAGAALDGLGAMPSWYTNANDKVDDWTGDIADFELSQLSDWGKKFKNDPTQLLIGAGDPFSAKAWSKVTGKDYTPYVNQMGGPTEDAYQSAENKGVDTSNARGAHQVAQTVASFYGGQGLGALGGAGGTAMGIGARGGQALLGAGVGGANAWANDQSFGEGALAGGLGSYLSSLDYAGGMGAENPFLKRGLNGAIGGAIGSGLSGENVGQGALMGAGKGIGSGLASMYTAGDMPDVGTAGGTQRDEYGENSYSMGGNTPQQAAADTGRVQLMSSPSREGAPTASAQSSSAVDDFMSALGTGVQKVGGIEGLGNLAAQAFGIYDNNRNRRRAKEQAESLNGLYGANSPYAQQMRQRMERQDAAAGRRSQYGTRETELAAKMADTQARMVPQLNQLYQQESGYRTNALKDSLMLGNSLYKLYNTPGGN